MEYIGGGCLPLQTIGRLALPPSYPLIVYKMRLIVRVHRTYFGVSVRSAGRGNVSFVSVVSRRHTSTAVSRIAIVDWAAVLGADQRRQEHVQEQNGDGLRTRKTMFNIFVLIIGYRFDGYR